MQKLLLQMTPPPAMAPASQLPTASLMQKMLGRDAFGRDVHRDVWGSTSSAIPIGASLTKSVSWSQSKVSGSALSVALALQHSRSVASSSPQMLVHNEQHLRTVQKEKVEAAADLAKDRNLMDADFRPDFITFPKKLLNKHNRWTEPLPNVSPEGMPLIGLSSMRMVAGQPSHSMQPSKARTAYIHIAAARRERRGAETVLRSP